MEHKTRHAARLTSDYQLGRSWRATVDLSVLGDENLQVEVRASAAIHTLHLHWSTCGDRALSALLESFRSALDHVGSG
jgi:hypothetical protein